MGTEGGWGVTSIILLDKFVMLPLLFPLFSFLPVTERGVQNVVAADISTSLDAVLTPELLIYVLQLTVKRKIQVVGLRKICRA